MVSFTDNALMLKINLLPRGSEIASSLGQPTATHLSGLHFLIHPLSIANPQSAANNYPDPCYRQRALELGQRYRAAARHLSANEVLIVFLHLTRNEMERAPAPGRQLMETFLRDLQDMVGPRLFYYYFDEAKPMIREQRPLANDVRDTAKRLARDLEQAGFTYSPDVALRFYGEELDCCVSRTARYLTRQLHLSSQPRVDLHMTDQFKLAENDHRTLIAKQEELKGLGLLLDAPAERPQHPGQKSNTEI